MPKTKIYPEVELKLCSPLTASQAALLLGWQEEGEDENFGNDYDLLDLHKKKIRLSNNQSNRPFDKSNARNWMSEILKGNWKLNGETCIIGAYGNCLDCQHRFVALVLASQEFDLHSENWEFWNEEPTIECLVVFGIEEDDETVNTINTGKPRSFADVVFRSNYFNDYKTSDRKKVSKILEWTVKFVAYRTGAFVNAYAAKQTHAELVNFVERHPTIIQAAQFIFETNGDSENSIKKFIALGSSAGLLYLMASSKSNGKEWQLLSSEESLNLSRLELAKNFWLSLAEDDKTFNAIKKLIASLVDESGATNPERVSILVKAWKCFIEEKPITKNKLALNYSKNEEGFKTLIDFPVVGGIDFGNPTDSIDDPTPKEIVDVKKKQGPKPETIVKRVGAECLIGSNVWVIGDTDEEHWQGELTEIHLESKTGKVKAAQGFSGAGNVYEAPLLSIQTDQPEFEFSG
tara:strand:+ start:466 stop:1848 length:1383 start_codon:yes stop_codon:yes gene_type:complete